jgi:hypothetical protein
MALTRTALEGHDLTLDWRDFLADVPRDRAASDVALTQARFELLYDYTYDTAQGSHQGYRVDHVSVRVTLDRPKMWVVPSARTPELLLHEQGHYDIVALLARDLFGELTGWESSNPPRRFRKDPDLKSAVARLSREALRLADYVSGSSRTVGVYDTQTDHGRKSAVQDKWNAALAAARSKGTSVTTALSGLGAGAPP